MVDLIVYAGITLALILLGLFAGRAAERRHLRSLDRREEQLRKLLVTDLRGFPGGARPDKPPMLVVSEVVIATDYLKTFLAGLRNIFGGRVESFQTLVTRARREALLRIMEDAAEQGYDAVGNVRLETADIGGATYRKGNVAVGVVASGTAYCRGASVSL